MAISTEERQEIIALTVGMFGAAPGADFLSEFADAIDGGDTINTLANNLASTDVFNNQFAGQVTLEDKIDVALNNMGFNTGTAAHDEATDFFVARLQTDTPAGDIFVEAVNFLMQDSVSAPFQDVATAFQNKVEVATFYSVDAAKSSTDITVLKDVIDDVTADPATVQAAKDEIQAGSTFSLTANPDVPGASAPSVDTLGTAGDDTYSAIVDASATTTLNTADELDGQGGTDRLNVRIVDAGGVTVSPVLDNIENIFLRNQDGSVATFTLNAASATGVEQYWSQNSVAGSSTAVSNIGNNDATIGLDNAAGAYTAGFDDLTGSDDTLDVAITGTTAGDLDVGPTQGHEAISIASTGSADNTLDVDAGTGVTDITVSGSAGLTLTDSASDFTGVTSVDASGLDVAGAAGLDIDLRQNTNNVTFTGTNGDDRIVMGEAQTGFNSSDTLNAGDGDNDTLVLDGDSLNAASAATLNNLLNNSTSGFEVLELDDRAPDLDAADVTVLDRFVFTDASAVGPFNGVEVFDTQDDDFFTIRATTAGRSEFDAEVASNILNLTLDGGGAAAKAGDLILTGGNRSGSGYNTVNLESIGDTGTNLTGAVTNDSNTTFNITGDHDLTIDSLSDEATVDASTFTGNLDITGSSDGDTLTAGNGDDTLNGGGGDGVADVLTGNGGADTFVFADATGGNDSDRVTDFALDDTVAVSDGAIGVGGDTSIDGFQKTATGNFGTAAEITVITTFASSSIAIGDDTNNVVASQTIGSADDNFSVGQEMLFAVSDGTSTGLYQFTDDGSANASVDSTELTLVGQLNDFSDVANLTAGNFEFIA